MLSKEEIRAIYLELQPIITDLCEIVAKMANCSAILMQQVKSTDAKVKRIMHKTYDAEGQPYGNCESGYYRWLRELSESEKGVENGH